ncbi:hypothetical protein KIN20_020369 [Parelaphostrongylus tenuis]|uniref:Uncharacterized protein n=1 Tax=Parelaphostrongylus tenuis TaxID=148309 RepID=A0AAD5N355_PARTN|nr:hypothetical protein KIN20_020369 [Parelaphostrongylus tenuis]
MLICPINQDPRDRVKLSDKQSLKLSEKIRLCQPVIWPMSCSLCQGHKEEVNRFGLESLGRRFARSVSVQFPPLQVIGALVGQEEVSRHQSFVSKIGWLVCIEE